MPDNNHEDLGFDAFLEETRAMTPLPASEIRRLGDRRRTRRRTGIAASVAGVTAVAVTALAIGTGFNRRDTPEIAAPSSVVASPSTASPTTTPSPTSSAPQTPSPTNEASRTTQNTPTVTPSSDPAQTSPPATVSPTATTTQATPGSTGPALTQGPFTVPTWVNVPTVAEMFPNAQTPVKQTGQFEGIGQAAVGLCDPGEHGAPTKVLRREFAWTRDSKASKTAVVFSYASVDEATAQYQRLTRAAANCKTQLTSTGHTRVSSYRYDDLPFNPDVVDVSPTRAGFYGASGAKPEQVDEGWWNVSMVIQSGNRVLWTVQTFIGQDYNCSAQKDDVAGQCDFPASMDAMTKRLVRQS